LLQSVSDGESLVADLNGLAHASVSIILTLGRFRLLIKIP